MSGPRPSSRGAAARPGVQQERGRDQRAWPAAARTHRSAVRTPAPGLHSELHVPAAPRPPGAFAPHHTTSSGASDTASGRATAAATPPLGWGPGRIKRGAQRRFRQPGPAHRAASPGLASNSTNGKRQGRGASAAPRGGGLRRRWLSVRPLPGRGIGFWLMSLPEWNGGATLGGVYCRGFCIASVYGAPIQYSPFKFPSIL